MIDNELYVAEELDTFLEARQVGQPIELPPDLPLEEWQLADKLLGISTNVLPNAQFLDNLENQIQAAARRSKTTGISSDKTNPIGKRRELTDAYSINPQFRGRQPLDMSVAASIVIDSLRIFLAPASFPPSEWHERRPYE